MQRRSVRPSMPMTRTTQRDWLRIAEQVWTYRQMSLGTVDASTVTLAERLRERQIATLDLRHFGVVRPAHVQRFELLP